MVSIAWSTAVAEMEFSARRWCDSQEVTTESSEACDDRRAHRSPSPCWHFEASASENLCVLPSPVLRGVTYCVQAFAQMAKITVVRLQAQNS